MARHHKLGEGGGRDARPADLVTLESAVALGGVNVEGRYESESAFNEPDRGGELTPPVTQVDGRVDPLVKSQPVRPQIRPCQSSAVGGRGDERPEIYIAPVARRS